MDTKAKPAFPRPTAQWWFDCKAALKDDGGNKSRASLQHSSLFADESKSVFVASVDSNAMDYQLDSQRAAAASNLDVQVITVDRGNNEWVMHGQPASEEFHGSHASLSSSSCKTNNLLIFVPLLFILLSNRPLHTAVSLL